MIGHAASQAPDSTPAPAAQVSAGLERVTGGALYGVHEAPTRYFVGRKVRHVMARTDS